MISMLREFTKSWIFTALMGLLIASFAFFGLRDVFTPVNDNNVIIAGKRTVSADEFKKDFEQYKQGQAEKGQVISNEDFVKAGTHLQMIEQLANRTAVLAWLDKIGVKPSARLIVDQIAKTPDFFNNVTGKFDRDTYRSVLARNDMTEAQFETRQRDQLAINQFFDAAMAGLKTPRIFASSYAAVNMQKRDTSVFVLAPANVAKVAPPSDAELLAYYKLHAKDLAKPEYRLAEVIQFSPADYLKNIPVDDAELHKMYQARLATLVTPETRSFTEITAPNMTAAKAISDGMKAGKDVQALAKANKGEVLTFDMKREADIPDAKIAAAAFAMKTDDVSDPIQGSLGIAVVRMGDIKIGSTPSFESVQDQLKTEYLQEKAADKVNDVTTAFQKAHDAGEDFDATAKALGLTVQRLAPMTIDGKTDGQQDYSKFGNLVKDVFDLQKGGTSDVEEFGGGQYFALKLLDVQPAGAPPFELVKGNLAQNWLVEKLTDELQAAADDAKARMGKGETLEAVAASYHAPVQKIDNLDRQIAQQALQSGKLPQGLVSHIFGGKAGETFTTPVAPLQTGVGRIDTIRQSEPNAVNVVTTGLGTQMTQMIDNDLAEAGQTSARTAVKTVTYPKIAVGTLGVTLPDAKAKPAKDSKSKS